MKYVGFFTFVFANLCVFAPINFLQAAPIVLALKPDKDPERMMAERKKLETYLSTAMSQPVQVIVPLSSAVILQGFQNGSIDAGYFSSVDMVQSEDKNIAEVLLAGDFNGKQSYSSIWLCRKDSSYQSISELRNRRIAFASPTSTSGFLIPFWDLVKQGLLKEKENPEAFFGSKNVFYGSGYVSAVKMLLKADVEAAAVSDYVFETDRFLSPEEKAQIRVCDTQGPVPSHSIAVRTSLDKETKQKLEKALLNLDSNPETQKLRDQVFSSGLVKVDSKKHLETTREALKVSGRL